MLFFLKSHWNKKFFVLQYEYVSLTLLDRLSVSLRQNKMSIYKIRAFKTYSLSLSFWWHHPELQLLIKLFVQLNSLKSLKHPVPTLQIDTEAVAEIGYFFLFICNPIKKYIAVSTIFL